MCELSTSVQAIADAANDILRRIESNADEELVIAFGERLRQRRLDLLAQAVKQPDGKLYVQLGNAPGERGKGRCELDDYGLPVLRVRDIAHHVSASFRFAASESEAAHA